MSRNAQPVPHRCRVWSGRSPPSPPRTCRARCCGTGDCSRSRSRTDRRGRRCRSRRRRRPGPSPTDRATPQAPVTSSKVPLPRFRYRCGRGSWPFGKPSSVVPLTRKMSSRAVGVVVDQRDARSGRLEQIPVRGLPSEGRRRRQAGVRTERAKREAGIAGRHRDARPLSGGSIAGGASSGRLSGCRSAAARKRGGLRLGFPLVQRDRLWQTPARRRPGRFAAAAPGRC